MKSLNFLDLASLLWRRKVLIMVPVLIGLGLGYGVYSRIPPKYRAGTMILVESQKIPKDYVKTTVTTSIQDRLRTIEQQITNRENMERIIQEAQLFTELRGDVPMEEIVRRTRNNLSVRVQGTSIFRIIFSGSDPDTVARVANRLAEVFIEENLKLREDEVENTSVFLEGELEETKRQLEDEEAEVADFRIRYGNMLPSQRETNRGAIEQLQMRLQRNLDATDQAEMRLMLVQSSISGNNPVSVGEVREGRSRLEILRDELAELKSAFTDRHPDVLRLNQEIAALEEQLLAADAPTVEVEELSLEGLGGAAEWELADVQRTQERLLIERQDLLSQIAVYQRRLEAIPRIEQEFAKLTRDYDNLERNYQSLLAKRLDARLAQNLERRQQGEQFSILEKAVRPSRPYAPQKGLILAVCSALGLALGVGLAFLTEEVVQSFRSAEALQQSFPAVKIMACIPRIKVDSQSPDGSAGETVRRVGGANA